MCCPDEVGALEREVGPLVGGRESLAFDLLQSRMTVDAEGVDPEVILKAVARAGMRAVPWNGETAGPPAPSENRLQVILAAISGGTLAAGAALQFTAGSGAAVPLYVAAILTGYRYVLPKAWLSLRRLRPDMHLLMTVAVIGAILIGEWLEAASVSFLFALALLLESWSVDRARRAVAALMDLAPATARRRCPADGDEDILPVEQVEAGDSLIVNPGERFPLDGRITSGRTTVNEAPITGESLPVDKAPGDEVWAGTINGPGSVEFEATRAAGETVLAGIIRMVGEAQARKAPVERWVDRFARIYTPSVFALSYLTMVAPPLFLGGSWAEWFYRGLVLLVIACPCALVISTPVSIVAGLASAARHGVLVKGGVYLEVPSRVRAVALDKTGTVTRGKMEVVEVVPEGEASPGEVLRTAASLEMRSNHPIARAVMRHAAEQGTVFSPAENVLDSPGEGIEGDIGGRKAWAGSPRAADASRVEELLGPGRTVIVVAEEGTVLGYVVLADTLRAGARRAVRDLHAAGVETVVLMTGDRREGAERAAQDAGVDEVRAELLPEQKVQVVEELESRFETVAVAGDGINDAPALARADLGVAMGSIGSDAAIEAADVALMTDDLTKLAWLIRHSRRTMSVVVQNIGFALGVKAVFVALAYLGYASLWAAIAADMGASLLVTFNGLRLLRD